MPIWSDFFKLFTGSAEQDPLSKAKNPKQFPSAGISTPEALGGGDFSGGQSSLRQTTDMIDTTTLQNRTMRYKEYERLRNVPEIEMAMQVFADEACFVGSTKVATPFGFKTIKELAETQADDRFLVYSFDSKKQDFTLDWAFSPRLVKTEKTIKVILDNGSTFTVTADHKVLKRDGNWIAAGDLKFGDELMPFYRVPANTSLNSMATRQFARIFTLNRGWISERQFIDEWKTGKANPKYEKFNKISKMLGAELSTVDIVKTSSTYRLTLENEGFTLKEIRWLYNKEDRRRVLSVVPDETQPVYDLSVEYNKCFATDNVILHNCQKDESGNILRIEVKNDEIREELEFFLLHRKMLNLNRNGPIWFKNLCIFGDWFVENVVNPDNPKEGIYRALPLPPETIFRVESVKGKLVEFQQAKEGPDYKAITNGPISNQSETEITQTTAIRFAPSQIIHFRIGDDRKTFFPYGQSLIEPARGPAHTLRMMEDAMTVYRLSRAAERRVFYIDVGQLPPFKAEAFLDRLKDQFRKRKTANNRGLPGANSVEEKWQPPAQDEDIWIPIRPNSNTRIDTLPGAENLGEIDDAIYFRNKLLTSLNFPKNYFNNEDTNSTRITLSAQDCKFARMIERLQGHFEDGLLELAERHLQLRGFPDESYQDLKIKMTPPSDWRELSRAEVTLGRYGNAGTLKSGQLMSDYDIYTKILRYSDDDTEQMLARLKLQKLEDLKLQILAQNPALTGIGVPGQENSSNNQELGTEPGGPSAMPGPDGQTPQTPDNTQQDQPNPDKTNQQAPQNPEGPPHETINIPEPDKDDIKKYDLELQSYGSEQDIEDIDHSIED